MLDGFTPLETSVLLWMCEQEPVLGPDLRRMLETMRIVSRENTGHGFYTTVEVDRSHPPLSAHRIGGPTAYMRDMGPGQTMGFVLDFKAGYPIFLEGYQNVDDNGDTVDLRTRDLASVGFERLEA